jgi:uncharacterized membrane protein YbaN (DUF454 family)
MQTDAHPLANVPTKLIAAGVIVVCVLLGFAGLLLPLIPGLLFLGIAAVVAARHSPRFAEMLRQNATLRGYLDRTEGIGALPFADQAKLIGLLIVKATIDGVAALVAGVMRVVKAAERV